MPLEESERSEPPRVLGAISATCVVIGAIIGVGIFFNPSDVARLTQSGPMALLTWTIAGAIALCGALAFAELGGMYRGSGAQYTLLRDSYGSFPAFVFGFCLVTVLVPGSAGVIALVCAQNILAVAAWNAGSDTTGLASMLIAIVLILLLMIANMIGVRWGSTIQNITTYAKVLVLLAITGLAILLAPEPQIESTDAAWATPTGTALTGVLAALVPTLFAFGGWQQVLWIAGEVRQPRRNLPLSIIAGVVIVIATYLLVNWAYLQLLGLTGVAQSKALASDAVGAVWPNVGRRVAAMAVAVSAFGVLNVQLLTAPRLVLGMARDGRFFRPFAKVNAATGTPVHGIALIAGSSILLLLASGSNAISRLVTAVVMIDAVFFAMSGLAVLILRYRQPAADRPVRAIGYPIVPLLFVVGEIGVLIGSWMDESVRGAAMFASIWIAVAAITYVIFFAKRSVAIIETASGGKS